MKNFITSEKQIRKLLLVIILPFFIMQNSFAQINSPAQAQENSSSVQNDSAKTSEEYVPLSQFTYAGERRFTLDGSMPLEKTKLRLGNAAIVGGVYLGAIIFLHIHQTNAWWSGQRGKFHFEEDWVSALQVDKAGHSYGGYIISYIMSEGLMASGFSWDDATIYGAGFGLLYQTYVETEDGFAKTWGFSPSDWYFDAIGPLFFLSQHYVPALQNITPKWQYIPSEWTGQPVINRPRTFIDDYNSSTFWWSLNVYNILPDSWKSYWVPWLNIAVGYGANAIDVKADPNGPPDQLSQRRFVIGLDYNLVKLLPEGGTFWNWLRQSLNYIKLPLPALEFSNSGTKFSLLYPFRFNLNGFKF
ncbi:MAG: DUF2279 domain-containing protein [Ignavibacteriaceae bacterium]